MFAVVDYNCGNLASLGKAMQRLGAPFEFVSTPLGLQKKEGVILPGVGNFGFAVDNLDALNLRHAIVDAARAGVPLLGICLGMQLLFEASEEAKGDHQGLALLEGSVRPLRSLGVTGRVPHVGWNSLKVRHPSSRLLSGVIGNHDVYFVHSFAVVPTDTSVVSATTDYCEVDITAAVEIGNVFGVQFHPEKSSSVGHQVLKNFIELSCLNSE